VSDSKPTPQAGDVTSFRKLSHLEICLHQPVEAHTSPHWEDFQFVHRAIPDLDWEEIVTTTQVFGKKLSLPFMAAAMTGGHPEVRPINEAIARVAEKIKIGMGVGSERAAIEKNHPYITESFQVVRSLAPTALIIGNLGAAQFSRKGGFGVKEAKAAVSLIGADVLAVHVNPAQEVVQVEGDNFFHHFFTQVSDMADQLNVPVILKEVGSGFAREEAAKVDASPLAGIDVGGLGGTSWIGVEALRAEQKNDTFHANLGRLFWDWGIPTAISLVEVRSATNKTVIATGGVRNGLDAAKAIALGADIVGMALPLLKPAQQGDDALLGFIQHFERELRTAMFLTGCRTLSDLRQAALVVTGLSRDWLSQRGIALAMPWRK
jgi:isopentenyl-diphosphate delta-isomerase